MKEHEEKMDELGEVYEQLVSDYENSLNEIIVLSDQLQATENLKILDGNGSEKGSASTEKPKSKGQPQFAPISDSIDKVKVNPEMETLKQTFKLIKNH